MPEHDLTFVAPDRRAEVLKRIDAVERFLADPEPASAQRYARELGLRRSQFYLLAQAWKTTRRPDAIAGAGRPKVRRLTVSDAQAAFMDDVIAGNPSVPIAGLVHLILARAAACNRDLPAQEVVTRYVARARPKILPIGSGASAGLIVDHTVLEIPVRFDGGPARRPLASLVIDTTREQVVGLALSSGTPKPAAAAEALLDALRRPAQSCASTPCLTLKISLRTGMDEDWTSFEKALARAGIDVAKDVRGKYQHGQIAEALLGRSCGGIRLRPRLVMATGSRRLSGNNDPARQLSLDDAEAVARGWMIGGNTTSAFAALEPAGLALLNEGLVALARGD